MHPTLWIKGNKSNSLSGKTIVIGVTGCIAAVRIIELARELIRRGATVYAVTTPASEKIIHHAALHYATGNEVIREITGKVEHVEFCGIKGKADLLLIAPATANTIGKIAQGIDDTPVTAFATTALGSNIPIILVPAMHESMYRHLTVASNISTLESMEIEIIRPIIKEGIAKIASNDSIVLLVERKLNNALKGKRILITSGSNIESIDPMRILTTRASGKTGEELAKMAVRMGASKVTIIHRKNQEIPGINEISVESSKQMMDAVLFELKNGYDIFISAAAVSDYTLDSMPYKIKSNKEFTLNFKPTKKIIFKVRELYPNIIIVGFKAEANVSEDMIIQISKKALEKNKLDLIVANDIGRVEIGGNENSVYIIDSKSKPYLMKASKEKIAQEIFKRIIDINE